jgi:hypothetical protein
VVKAARDVHMFICNHNTSLAIYMKYMRKELLEPAKTRYASYFLLLDKMKVQKALQQMFAIMEWSKRSESNKAR